MTAADELRKAVPVNRSRYLRDLIGALIERRFNPVRKTDARSIEALCAALLTEVGDVSTVGIGHQILAGYREADADEKRRFFAHLAHALDIDAAAVARLAGQYASEPAAAILADLMRAAEPRRQELLRRLNRVPGATGQLVAMRCDLFRAINDDPALAKIDMDFGHLLSSWFNPGFLVLRRIDWATPANILEKIIAYEAVHEIRDWDDLRARLQPPDRRCFALFHPSMPEEPLIFVEVALCKGVARSIQAVLAAERAILRPETADTAVFYSISNCQPGLRGVSFGNALIKQVVEKLKREFPHLATFVTLSPIPGLASWRDDAGGAVAPGADPRWRAARYLVEAKRPDGTPQDAVARFHLGNGAIILDVHADADLSAKGMAQSGGVMVNYHYDPDRIDGNLTAFFSANRVAVSSRIRRLLNMPGDRAAAAA